MDNAYRLKIKIGPHEFEAEGPADVVQEQFRIFKDLIASSPAPAVPQPQSEMLSEGAQPQNQQSKQDLASVDSRLDKILRVNQRVVSLTVRPPDMEDAVLLILYGQKMLRQKDEVTGGEVMAGLVVTGGYSVTRVDRLLEGMARVGNVIVIGERRSKRYRLTNVGLNVARTVADSMLAVIA